MNIRTHERHKKTVKINPRPSTAYRRAQTSRATFRGQNLRILSPPRRHPSRVGFAPTARRRPRPRRRRPRAVGARLRASKSSRADVAPSRARARRATDARDRRARRIPRRRHIAGTRSMMDGATPRRRRRRRRRRPRRADTRATICVDMVRVRASRRARVPRVVRTTPCEWMDGWMDGAMVRCDASPGARRNPRGWSSRSRESRTGRRSTEIDEIDGAPSRRAPRVAPRVAPRPARRRRRRAVPQRPTPRARGRGISRTTTRVRRTWAIACVL